MFNFVQLKVIKEVLMLP